MYTSPEKTEKEKQKQLKCIVIRWSKDDYSDVNLFGDSKGNPYIFNNAKEAMDKAIPLSDKFKIINFANCRIGILNDAWK